MDSVYFVLGVLANCLIGGFNICCAIHHLRNEKLFCFGLSVMYVIATVLIMTVVTVKYIFGL